MNSVFLPVQVSVFLRRLANIVSTLSVSNQYLAHRHQQNQLHPTPLSDHASPAPEPLLQSTATAVETETREAPGLPGIGDEPRRAPPPVQDPPKPPTPPNSNLPSDPDNNHIIKQLMENPALYDPVRAPRFPIALCHGLYGFDVRGFESIPSLRVHYWSNVLDILRKKIGAEVIVTAVPPTGSIASRAESLDKILREKARGRGINLMAHSMGGLDCRHLITHIQPREYRPLSLTTVSTPHRGSAFMDWCAENLGLGRARQKERAIESNKSSENDPEFNRRLTEETEADSTITGWQDYVSRSTSMQSSPLSPSPPPSTSSKHKQSDPATKTTATEKHNASNGFRLSLSALPSSFTSLLTGVIDSPAYANLTTAFLNDVFNPATPDAPDVKYFSVTSRVENMSVWHPLWLPKMVLDGTEEKARKEYEKKYGNSEIWGNDGLVSVQSAKWGQFLGVLEGPDHWEVRGARGIDFNRDLGLPPGSSLSDTGIWDWGKFVGAFKKAEQATGEGDKKAAMVQATHASKAHGSPTKERDGQGSKSATERLSTVFDWLRNQVPSPPKLTSSGTKAAKDEAADTDKNKGVKNDLRTMADLERFYVALSRNLYENGL